jgi:hypothetical protein
MSNNLISGLVHVVHFWVKPGVSESELKDFIQGVKGLANIEGVKQAHVGVAANSEKRDVVDNSFTVSEMLFFDDEAAEHKYQIHPDHKAFVDRFSHLWEKVVVQDSVSA